jgi:hypothetical protein
MTIFHPDRDGGAIMHDIDGYPHSIYGQWANDSTQYIVSRVFRDNARANYFYEHRGSAKLVLKLKLTGTASAFSLKTWGTRGYE